MPAQDTIKLLKDLLHATRATPSGLREARFRADHPDDQELIDTLIRSARIERKQEHVVLRPLGLAELAPADPVAADLLRRCAQVFEALRQYAIANPDTSILVSDLAAHLGLFRSDVVLILEHMLDAPIWSTYSNDLNSEGAYVTPGVNSILRFKKYHDVIEQFRAWASETSTPTALQPLEAETLGPSGWSTKQAYVDLQRLCELRVVKSADWDLSRLVRLCEELNGAYECRSWMSCAMLVRSILDHVPPIFGYPNFGAFANNYRAPQSFSRLMQRLDTSLRSIADGYLHVQVRSKESLPTFTQVNFCADLDVLLAEIVRTLK